MMHFFTCAFCREKIDRHEQTKVTTTDKGTLRFYHVTPDCWAAEKMRRRMEQLYRQEQWADVR